MAAFNVKIEQLLIVLGPRGCPDNVLTKALTIIHNDVIGCKQAAREYFGKGLMTGLVNLSRSSCNILVIILSTSLMYALCCYGDVYKEKFIELNGAVHLLAMISSRDNSGKSKEHLNQTLLLHEQAAKLIVLLTSSGSKFQQQLVTLGIINKVVELCDVFFNGSHTNCCFGAMEFSDDALHLTKQLTEGRKLVGKIDPQQSAETKRGVLSILAVDLYDTSTDEDVNINKQLLKLGVAWSDPLLTEGNNVESTSLNLSNEKIWSDFHITKVVDAHCFWAFIDSEAHSKINRLSKLLEEYVYTSDVCTLCDLKCGTRVCFAVTKETGTSWVRGCVLEVDTNSNSCQVMLVDYGIVVKIGNNLLFPIPNAINDIPHQANLCVLEGITAAPKNTLILEYAAEILSNLATSHALRMQIHMGGGTKALFKLCHVPNKKIVTKVFAALSNLSLNFNIRPQIGHMGGCKRILDLLREYIEDNECIEVLLSCLINLLMECIQNRKHIATSNGLLILIKIYRMPSTDLANKELVVKAVKNLVGNGWRLLDPINAPDVRGIVEDQMDSLKGCFNLSNLCGEEILEEVRKRRRKKNLRPGEVEPQPIYASLSVDELVKKLRGVVSSGDEFDSKSEGYKTGPDTDVDESCLCIEKRLSLNHVEGYFYRSLINVEEDERNAFMYGHSIRSIKAVDIGITICAMLNSGQGGVIYIGVANNRQVLGININRKERDNVRLGVDELLDAFKPRVKHDKYEIKFVQVMSGTSAADLKQHEERYVIEIYVSKNIDQVYQTGSKKMYFRDGSENSLLSIQQIREKTIREQEEKYQAEIKALQRTLEVTQQKLKDECVLVP